MKTIIVSFISSVVSIFIYIKLSEKPPVKFTGEWAITEGLRDLVITDTAAASQNGWKLPPKDSITYLSYYGRTFVSEEEVMRILADHRHRAAEAIRYYQDK